MFIKDPVTKQTVQVDDRLAQAILLEAAQQPDVRKTNGGAVEVVSQYLNSLFRPGNRLNPALLNAISDLQIAKNFDPFEAPATGVWNGMLMTAEQNGIYINPGYLSSLQPVSRKATINPTEFSFDANGEWNGNAGYTLAVISNPTAVIGWAIYITRSNDEDGDSVLNMAVNTLPSAYSSTVRQSNKNTPTLVFHPNSAAADEITSNATSALGVAPQVDITFANTGGSAYPTMVQAITDLGLTGRNVFAQVWPVTYDMLRNEDLTDILFDSSADNPLRELALAFFQARGKV